MVKNNNNHNATYPEGFACVTGNPSVLRRFTLSSRRLRTEKVRKSLRYSIFDGAAFSAMLGLTQDYIVPFALALKATTAQIGLLTSLPNLTSALSQLAVPRLVEKIGSRKKLFLPAVFLHAIMWLPILLIPYLFPGQKVWWLIALFTISTIAGTLGNPAWGSMMADLVPEEKRGRFFGFRGKIGGLLTLVFFFLGGAILSRMTENIFLGFAIIFGGAFLFRLASWYFLSRMYEPPMSSPKTGEYSLSGLLLNLSKTNVGRFIIYDSLMDFATYIAAPFFTVFMLRDLKFDYMSYVILISACSLSNVIFMSFWGVRADRAGNIKILHITSVLVPLVPLLWLVSHNFYFIIFVQAVAGFAWSGFNLASANFLYDAASPEKRTQYISICNALNGVAICLGAALGGLLASRLPPLFGYKLLTLFLISGLARSLVSYFLTRHVHEMRRIPETCLTEVLLGRRINRRALPRQASAPSVHAFSWLSWRRLFHAHHYIPSWRQKLDVAYRGKPVYPKHDSPDSLWGG